MSFLSPLVVAAISAALASLALTPAAMRLSLRAGAVSRPGGRRIHSALIPCWGGLAIWAGWLIGLGVGLAFVRNLPEDITLSQLVGVIVGSTLLGAAGGLDDWREMRPLPKLLVQVMCAAVAFGFGVRLRGIFGYPIPGWVSGLGTVIWIVALVNAINLIDGLDGLAAGVSAIAAVSFAYLGAVRHDYAAALMAGSLAGASVGFLPHNFSPAKVFMGDMGSQFMGFLIASIALLGTLKTTAAAAVLSAGLILAVPIGDTAFAVIRRIARRQPPFVADADHIHHRLVRGGLTDRQAVLLIYFTSALLSFAAIVLAKKG